MAFRCKIKDLDAYLLVLHNGLFEAKGIQIFAPPAGLTIEPHTENPSKIKLRIQANTKVEKPVQLVNIIDSDKAINQHNRIEIYLEEGAGLSLIHCDESLNKLENTIKTEVHIHLEKESVLNYYNLQNVNNQSTLDNQTDVHQEASSRFFSQTITLNGKTVQKEQKIILNGEYCEAEIMGLYLLDKNQHCANRIYVDHRKPNSHSNELFKGILDDSAQGHFTGYVHVAKHAQKTEAYQSNKNLLLTDKAKIYTQPFLEIYADDVKCSHGATVGQLDEEALFYLRTRAVPEKVARMMLMYAFADDVIKHIHISALREYMESLVRRRLNGEELNCESCAFALDCL